MSERKPVTEMDGGEFSAVLDQIDGHDLRRLVAWLHGYDPYAVAEALTALKLPHKPAAGDGA